MLPAHAVPGYFLAVRSRRHWDPHWGKVQRALLWVLAVGSTIAPDADVLYNALFRGFFGHTTLWTHSLFPYLVLCMCWWLLARWGCRPYLRTAMGLLTLGGLSHLLLDVLSHGRPLLYSISLVMVGAPPARALEGGGWAYVTDPIFLAEPLLLGSVVAHWIVTHEARRRVRRLMLLGLAGALATFIAAFVHLLPGLQALAAGMAG